MRIVWFKEGNSRRVRMAGQANQNNSTFRMAKPHGMFVCKESTMFAEKKRMEFHQHLLSTIF